MNRINLFRIMALCFIVLGFMVLFLREKDPIKSVSTNNSQIGLSLLFEHDGVKVYRFYDSGSYIYYTDARGKIAWQQSHGKTSNPTGVETVTGD